MTQLARLLIAVFGIASICSSSFAPDRMPTRISGVVHHASIEDRPVISKVASQGEAPPFYQDILQFKKDDIGTPPPATPILFIGSSSFTRWKNVQEDFRGYTILNRAFGGSTLIDVTRYFYDIVMPYQPKQVVIYCGENDLAASDSISAEAVTLRLKTIFGMIRTNLPKTRISFVSIKPSPSRRNIQDRVLKANHDIRSFIHKQKNADFINIYDAMLDANRNMREELYVADRLHMQPEGYAIWKKIMLPYLVK